MLLVQYAIEDMLEKLGAGRPSRYIDPGGGLGNRGTTGFDEVHDEHHRRLPLRQGSDRRGRRAVPGRPLPLPGLPQTPWCALPRLGNLPRECGEGRRRHVGICGPAFLPDMRIVRLWTFRRRGRTQSRRPRRAEPLPPDIRTLDGPARGLAAAVPASPPLSSRPRRQRPNEE